MWIKGRPRSLAASHATTGTISLLAAHLRLFEVAIVVGLNLHQRSKDVLVLVGILVPQKHLQQGMR